VIAKDSSGKGNDLSLLSSPSRMDTEIKSGGNALRTGSLGFKNNVALNKAVKGMPEKSFTVEFWARSKKLDSNKPDMQVRGVGCSWSAHVWLLYSCAWLAHV
jgi:hypothetical protein